MDGLSVEIILAIAEAFGPDTTVEDWVNISMVCQAWRQYVFTMFAVWLDAQPPGQSFGGFAGHAAEIGFLRRNVDSRY